MVVLPLPVGPVTRMMPSGRDIMIFSVRSDSFGNSSFSSGITPFSRSRTRNTMFSPWMVGCEATRKSIWRPTMVREIRPSCGARVSAMFMSDMTLSRTAIADQ